MDSLSNQVEFDYMFTSDEKDIPKNMKKDPSTALRVEGEFKIVINGEVYFEEKDGEDGYNWGWETGEYGWKTRFSIPIQDQRIEFL